MTRFIARIGATTPAEEEQAGRSFPRDFTDVMTSIQDRAEFYHIEVAGQTATMMFIPQARRVGIAQGDDVKWATSTGDLRQDVRDWLNHRHAWKR